MLPYRVRIDEIPVRGLKLLRLFCLLFDFLLVRIDEIPVRGLKLNRPQEGENARSSVRIDEIPVRGLKLSQLKGLRLQQIPSE